MQRSRYTHIASKYSPTHRSLQPVASTSVQPYLPLVEKPHLSVSDRGTQFTSQEFQDFTKTWGIHHRVTSPMNAQSNGQAEHFVQTIKKQPNKGHRRGRRSTLSKSCICHNTLEPQSTITRRVT